MMVGECILGCGGISMLLKVTSGNAVCVSLGKKWLWLKILCAEHRCFVLELWLTHRHGVKQRQADEVANLFPQALLFVSCALVVGFVQPLIDFLLLRRAPAKEHVIYKGIFKQGQEHKHKTAHEVDVDGFHIRNLWESLPKVGVNCCHGKHRCHTWAQQHTHRDKQFTIRQKLYCVSLLHLHILYIYIDMI